MSKAFKFGARYGDLAQAFDIDPGLTALDLIISGPIEVNEKMNEIPAVPMLIEARA